MSDSERSVRVAVIGLVTFLLFVGVLGLVWSW
jgi:hypothetical protein